MTARHPQRVHDGTDFLRSKTTSRIIESGWKKNIRFTQSEDQSMHRQFSKYLLLFLISISASIYSAEFDRYGGCKSISGKKTGRWHIEEINGRYWFVTPDGHGCFLTGVNHISSAGSKVDKETLQNLKNWNINCAGYNPGIFARSEMPYFVGLSLHSAEHWKTADSFGFDDVFCDTFADAVDKKIRLACEKNRNNPFAVGYALTDTPRYDIDISRKRRGNDWVSAIRRMGKETGGKQRYIRFLRERYKDIDLFKKAYRLEVNSFDQLLEYDFENIELTRKAIREDDYDFLTLIAERLCKLTQAAFKKYDPDAIVMSERFKKHDHTDAIIELAGRYYDVICVQPGPTTGPEAGQGPDESEFDAAYWRKLHQMTGKPIFICDHACSFYTPEYSRTLWHQFETETEAAHFYDFYLKQVIEEPYMPAYSRCQYKSRYDALRSLLKQGIVDIDGNPYSVLTEQIKKTNDYVQQTLYGEPD